MKTREELLKIERAKQPRVDHIDEAVNDFECWYGNKLIEEGEGRDQANRHTADLPDADEVWAEYLAELRIEETSRDHSRQKFLQAHRLLMEVDTDDIDWFYTEGYRDVVAAYHDISQFLCRVPDHGCAKHAMRRVKR